MTEDAPKKCPIRPEKMPTGILKAGLPGPGAEMQACIGERCQWWWKCREPEPFTMTISPAIEGADPARISPEEVNEAIQKFEAKISTARR